MPCHPLLFVFLPQISAQDIREFKMTLGNHPSATSGPPVMLSSDLHSPRKVMTLEQYEQTRPPRRKRRQLKLSLQQRHNVLVKERGFSFEEVKGAWQEALEIRKQRKETLERGYVDHLLIPLERRTEPGVAFLLFMFLIVCLHGFLFVARNPPFSPFLSLCLS